MEREQSLPHGFTLIELSIVLVIIGLLVGGVLVGQDLIRAAEVRAQISQIEKYNTAVNTFYGKYDAIPGDMNPATAGQFGFTVGTGCDGHSAGYRDGNGLIDGYFIGQNLFETIGETASFWVDLSTAGLIEGKYPNGGAAPVSGCGTGSAALGLTSGPNYLGDYFPEGKIGNGNFVYVYEDNGANWYGLSRPYLYQFSNRRCAVECNNPGCSSLQNRQKSG